MEIHKPKAARSYREFLIEIGTIVIGILIALGLEQAIEVIHERKIADEAREAVRAEVRENLWWVARSIWHETCDRQRMDELADLLDRARHGRAFAPMRNLGDLPFAKITSLRWEANAQAGRASLFSPQEQRYLGNMYFATSQFAHDQNQEQEAFAKLSAINGLDHLTQAEINDFSLIVAQLRYWHSSASLHALRSRQWAGLMRVSAENNDELRLGYKLTGKPTCRSILAPPPPQ